MKFDDQLVNKIAADFLFSREQDEKVGFDESELIELKPYGMSLHNDMSRPFLLLKDKAGLYTLPVGITQLEAGVTLTQSSRNQALVTPHLFTEKLLKSLDVTIERCLFVEISGLHQYVRLYMKGHPKYNSMKFKAEDVMSLCLHLGVPLFATASFIQKSKVMTAEISHIAQEGINRPEFEDFKKNCH